MEKKEIDYQIVPITENDIERFWQALGSVAREKQYLSFLDAPPIQMTTDFVKENIKGGWPHVIAVKADRVIGWCDISSLHRPIYAHSGVLGIGVVAEYRGFGVGAELMKTALSKAQEKGLTRVELTVRHNNKRAFALYEKLGFKVEGIHRNAVRLNGEYEDLISMAILFDNP